MKFGLSSTEVGLDQHPTSATIGDHAFQASLQDATTSEDHDGGDVAIERESIVRMAIQRGLYDTRLVQQRLGGFLDEYHRKAIKVEDKVFTIKARLHEGSVDASYLVRVEDDHIRRHGHVFRHFAKSSKLGLMQAGLLIKGLVNAIGDHADSDSIFDSARHDEVCIYPLAICFAPELCKC